MQFEIILLNRYSLQLSTVINGDAVFKDLAVRQYVVPRQCAPYSTRKGMSTEEYGAAKLLSPFYLHL